jgi:hypothetical protein
MEIFNNILNFVIGFISYILNLLDRLFGNQSFAGVFSALLGAIVGSISGYVFNARLERQRSKERYWIQRKNTIYSPIYKTLLSLRDYLHQAATSPRPFIRIELEHDYNIYNAFDFTLWQSIKRDVRYDYVPENLRLPLDELTSKLGLQEASQQMLTIRWKQITENFMKSNKSIFDENKHKNVNIDGGLYYTVETRFFPPNIKKENPITNYLNNYVKENHKKDIPQLVKKLEKKLIDVYEYKTLRSTLSKCIHYTDYSIEEYRRLITQIITAYEGGVKLE